LILQEIFPNPGTKHEVEDITSESLGKLYPIVPGFRFNYVISPDILDAKSDLATSPIDRIILKFIRSQSDLIVTTGLTAIQEIINSSSFAPMLILTRSENLIEIPALTKQSNLKVYVTQKLETSYMNSQAMAIGKVQQPLADFCLSFCELNGFETVALESGLTIASEFAQAGLLTEVDLTVTGVQSRQAAEEAALAFVTKLTPAVYLHQQLLQFEDNWFFRFASPKAMS
jgi:hypothetical protein